MVIAVATLIGILLNLLGINPISALVYSAVINGVVAVPLLVLMLLVANKRSIMGAHEWLAHQKCGHPDHGGDGSGGDGSGGDGSGGDGSGGVRPGCAILPTVSALGDESERIAGQRVRHARADIAPCR